MMRMKDSRWPKICLKEEMKGLKNDKASKEVGDGEIVEWIYQGREVRKIKERLARGLKIRTEQELQADWRKIDSSKFCEEYKERKRAAGREEYWEKGELCRRAREQWARMRCGSVGRSESKGFKDAQCRLCRSSQETLEHIWNCEEGKR
ncbi:hypothetical protein M0802_007891 [Mischocyttarus mexicanus]|nr:hypothetical protein M0802_007891 [Mischocyttarus mexicanus]